MIRTCMRAARCGGGPLVLLALAIVALVLVHGNEAGAQSTTEAIKSDVQDATITARIETLLMVNKHLSAFDIKTVTREGVVTLTGSVDNQVQKDLAGELARGVNGVKEVVNEIMVIEELPAPKSKRGFGQRIEDMTVSASVRTRLLYHKEFKGLKIGVRTENNVVTLSGIVDTEPQKQRITQIAAETQGVARVVDDLVVRPREGSTVLQELSRTVSDGVVEKHVETNILLNKHVSIRDLDVDVIDGNCILTGTVGTETEKELAAEIAGNTYGVAQVENHIQVSPPRSDSEPPAFQPSGAEPESTQQPSSETGEEGTSVPRPEIQSAPLEPQL